MKRYDVLSAINTGQLASDVEGFLASGWECQGGVAYDPLRYLYLQAMTYTPPITVVTDITHSVETRGDDIVLVRDGGGAE